MKRYIFLLTTLLMFSFVVKAQNKIDFTIAKVIENGENYLQISIKNSNSKDIAIISLAEWSGSNEYLKSPSSYFVFIGNPSTASTRKETGKIIITKEYDKRYPDRAPLYVKLEAGKTHTVKYKIFGEDWITYRSFPLSYKGKIQTLQVKVALKFIYDSKSLYDEEMVSNTISL